MATDKPIQAHDAMGSTERFGEPPYLQDEFGKPSLADAKTRKDEGRDPVIERFLGANAPELLKNYTPEILPGGEAVIYRSLIPMYTPVDREVLGVTVPGLRDTATNRRLQIVRAQNGDTTIAINDFHYRDANEQGDQLTVFEDRAYRFNKEGRLAGVLRHNYDSKNEHAMEAPVTAKVAKEALADIEKTLRIHSAVNPINWNFENEKVKNPTGLDGVVPHVAHNLRHPVTGLQPGEREQLEAQVGNAMEAGRLPMQNDPQLWEFAEAAAHKAHIKAPAIYVMPKGMHLPGGVVSVSMDAKDSPKDGQYAIILDPSMQVEQAAPTAKALVSMAIAELSLESKREGKATNRPLQYTIDEQAMEISGDPKTFRAALEQQANAPRYYANDSSASPSSAGGFLAGAASDMVKGGVSLTSPVADVMQGGADRRIVSVEERLANLDGYMGIAKKPESPARAEAIALPDFLENVTGRNGAKLSALDTQNLHYVPENLPSDVRPDQVVYAAQRLVKNRETALIVARDGEDTVIQVTEYKHKLHDANAQEGASTIESQSTRSYRFDGDQQLVVMQTKDAKGDSTKGYPLDEKTTRAAYSDMEKAYEAVSENAPIVWPPSDSPAFVSTEKFGHALEGAVGSTGSFFGFGKR